MVNLFTAPTFPMTKEEEMRLEQKVLFFYKHPDPRVFEEVLEARKVITAEAKDYFDAFLCMCLVKYPLYKEIDHPLNEFYESIAEEKVALLKDRVACGEATSADVQCIWFMFCACGDLRLASLLHEFIYRNVPDNSNTDREELQPWLTAVISYSAYTEIDAELRHKLEPLTPNITSLFDTLMAKFD